MTVITTTLYYDVYDGDELIGRALTKSLSGNIKQDYKVFGA